MLDLLSVDTARLSAICRRHGILRLALFGSAVREDFGPSSDVDVHVTFAPGRVPGLGFFRIQDELSEVFGRRVDLHTPGFLPPPVRSEVERSARVLPDAT